jgi:A/G-specific adenine glycosylase
VLTHRILLVDFYFAEALMPPALPADYQWVDEADLGDYAMPRLVEKLLELLHP